jgi:ABC-type polysaccharide/polyol phosphate export permease
MTDALLTTAEYQKKQSNARRAFADLVGGLERSWLWGQLAKEDIRLRYRGSLLGPLWVTLSTAIWIGSMGFLYARLFNSPAKNYLPFLSVGLIVWTYVASLITEGCGTFTAASSIIHQVPLPYSIHVYRLITRNTIVLAHNCVIIPFVLWMFHVVPSWTVCFVPFAVFVLALNGAWIAILFGILSSRFRDVPPIVASFVQVIFFVTPVFWTPSALGGWAFVGQLNPIFAAIDVIRGPVLGQHVSPYSWPILGLVTVVGWLVTFVVFARFRARIPFWVA